MTDNAEQYIGFDALYESMWKCKKGTIWKDSVAYFVDNAAEEAIKLEQEIKSGTYRARKPKRIKITVPKVRDGVCIPFRDRVYQRSLNDNAIYPEMSRHFIHHNAACQKGKGTDFARDVLVEFLRHYYRHRGTEGAVLQGDVKGYYGHMRETVVEKKFKKHLAPDVYGHAQVVLHDQAGENGVGYNPGSQMVQIAGISTLDEIDHFIKERLHIRYYLRYMDDFVLIHPDKQYLQYCKEEISKEFNEIGFEMHPKKTKLYSIKEGILFLGFIFRLTETGKVIRTVNPEKVKEWRRKLPRLVRKAQRGEIEKRKVDKTYECIRNHALKGNSCNLVKRMDAFYKRLWEESHV